MLPTNRIAFVIDNMVVDVLHTDDRLAAIFLSEPQIFDVTNKQNSEKISVNSIYDPNTEEFSDAPINDTRFDNEAIIEDSEDDDLYDL